MEPRCHVTHELILMGNGLCSIHGNIFRKFWLKQCENGSEECRTFGLVGFVQDIEVFCQYLWQYFITRRKPILHWFKIQVKDNGTLHIQLYPNKNSIQRKAMTITSVKSLDFLAPKLYMMEQNFLIFLRTRIRKLFLQITIEHINGLSIISLCECLK